MAELHAGTMVTPSVRLVRPLGEGGMGTVWVAEHLTLATQVVVKFIANELRASKEAKERFEREAKAASQVKSPHVVQTFDHGTTADGIPYIVMELLEGRDLGAYLEANGRVQPPQLVVDIVAQLARALDRAHERGIIHRDIKPGNIFLCDSGGGEVFVKLLDFGIAKGVDVPRIDSNTKTGTMVGSPFYMSPEQILGQKVDKRSDLWSVGVVAFEALTGKKPFDAETMGGLAIKIHSEPLPRPTQFAPELPATVDAWFARACARNVEERYTSAKELAEELAAAVGGEMPRSLEVPRLHTGSGARETPEPTFASTEAGVVRSTLGPRRRNVVFGLAVTVLLGVVAFGITSMVKGSKTSGAALVSDAPASVSVKVEPPPSAPPELAAPPMPAPPLETAEPAAPVVPVTAAKHPARPGHAGRPLPPPKASATIASPPSTTTAAPPATTSPPATTGPKGHDIF